MSPNDRDLLLRFSRNGDQDAFGVLVRQYIGLVYHSAFRRVGDAHAAEDITQQVFTLLARKAARVCAHETLIGWLHTTTRLEAHQFLRRERRRAAREKEASMSDDLQAAQPVRDWEKLQPVIDAALDQLNDGDRDAVLMRFFNNQSFAAIGEQLGVTENTARMRVDRALDKLNGFLSARKITSMSLAATLATEAVAASAPPTLAAQVTAQALAGAALGAGGGIAATLFTMTTSSKIILATACGLVALGLGSAVFEGHQLADARVQVAEAKRQLDAAHAASAADKTRIAALEKELASAKLVQTPVTKPAPGSAPRAQQRWSNPEYTRLQLDRYRASLSGKYSSLYRMLHLTKEQIEAFEAIQVESQQSIYDIWAAAESQGIAVGNDSSARTGVVRMTSEPLALRDKKLQDLLGEENMKQFTDYDSPKAANAVTFIPALAADLYSTGTPLTTDQGDQLRRAILDHTETTRVPLASAGNQTAYQIVSKTDWEAVNEAAGAFLSEQQRVVLKNRATIDAADAQLKILGTTSAK